MIELSLVFPLNSVALSKGKGLLLVLGAFGFGTWGWTWIGNNRLLSFVVCYLPACG